jgi:hypothetical protein
VAPRLLVWRIEEKIQGEQTLRSIACWAISLVSPEGIDPLVALRQE